MYTVCWSPTANRTVLKVLGNIYFHLVSWSNGIGLVQMKDMQLDTLMDTGRWMYFASVKPHTVFTNNFNKKTLRGIRKSIYLSRILRGILIVPRIQGYL